MTGVTRAPGFWLLAAACLMLAPAVRAQMFGAGRQYVKVSVGPAQAAAGKPFSLLVTLDIEKGIHIQANKPAPNYIATVVKVTPPKDCKVGTPVFPTPIQATVAGETIPVFEGRVLVKVPVTPAKGAKGAQKFTVKVDYQACNAQSCFPPAHAAGAGSVKLTAPTKRTEAGTTGSKPDTPPAVGTTTADPSSQSVNIGTAPVVGYTMHKLERFAPPEEFVRFLRTGSTDPDTGAGTLGRLLGAGNLVLALPLIFVLGLALNLTPCVYPIIPITISYFGGQASAGRKPFTLAIFYVLGMALMYSVLGVAAGLTGSLFGNQLQNPWVLAAFALIMFTLALSQFDRPNGMPIWEFQLPAGLRNRAQGRSGAVGAMLMGLMVGVVAAPCIGPAVVALLQWVGTQKDPLLGFMVFFTLALGLGLPYLFLAAVSGSVRKLPRSGEWMIGVKHIFGVVMIWMGFYYLGTVLDRVSAGLGMKALLAVTMLGGLYLLFFDRSGAKARGFFAVKRALGAVAVIIAVWMALPRPAPAIRWQAYTPDALEQARTQGKNVLVDFTATWCAACKELEHKTFTDAKVGAQARDFVTLRADMTDFNGPASQKLVQQYGIVGLPTVARLVPAERAAAR